MKEPAIKRLESGYLHVRWSAQSWLQLPPGYCGASIAEYAFGGEESVAKMQDWWERRWSGYALTPTPEEP